MSIEESLALDQNFLIQPDELRLAFTFPVSERQLSFARAIGRHARDPERWRHACIAKLAELLNVQPSTAGPVRELRVTSVSGITVKALTLNVEKGLTLPAYLLLPDQNRSPGTAVVAIHGHGEVEPCIGMSNDYHHAFALNLALAGYTVLCPELRGFGVLKDLAAGLAGHRMDYWNWGEHMAYSLVTECFQYGHTLMGDTIMDLLRWEDWLAQVYAVDCVHVAGISYGGDLALAYPVFSKRVDCIFASGTLGSFSAIFARCYNAPAHCIPGVLSWMDRSDIAGLNAPRPLALHYGELDRPGDGNYSASYNETVDNSVHELRAIYKAFGAEEAVELIVTPGKGHEMDNAALLSFFAEMDND